MRTSVTLNRINSEASLQNYLNHLCLIFSLLLFSGPIFAEPNVLVSVSPYKFFVEKIAGDTVSVSVMVPAGASAHTYEPSPRGMLEASRGDIWFLIGEPFETKASAAITSHNTAMTLVDLRQGVDLISCDPHHKHHVHCTHCNCEDLHIWLSPRQSKIQAKTIADTLAARYPENRALYMENLNKFQTELDQLDHDITESLKPLKTRVIMVSHPAYGYFCRDYQLDMISIEFEGKDPTPRQLTQVITDARKNHIKKIFTQMQYSSKGAKLIASQIGAVTVELDPYSEHYITSMRHIAEEIASSEG